MIHPRRLTGKAGNIARYYSVGDYYTKSTAEQSEWGGKLAEELGLVGRVEPETLRKLLAGEVAGQQLGRHRADGEIQHHPGWDFAVNAPKSVSIMALVSGDARIIAAHERAVRTALDYLEEHAALRRREDGRVVQETTGRLLLARFTEHASRELDPHLHTHVVVLNMTNREVNAPMASLETRAMFAEQMAAGQVYRNDLAHGLREQGYEVAFDPRRGLFEIRDVPAALIAAMSQRADQIDAHAKEHGLSGQAARRQSFYATRGGKAKASLEQLRTLWTARSLSHATALDDVRRKAENRGERAIVPAPASVRRATLFGMRQAETREAVNSLGQLIRIGLASDVGEVRLADVRPLFAEHERRAKLLATRHETGDRILTRGRTTRRTLRLEQRISFHLALSLDDARPITSANRLCAVLGTAGLTFAQEQALVGLATSRDRVNGLHGVAGAGKSTLVRTLAEAAEPGTTVLALAPTSSAAANLGTGARVDSRTVASLLAGGGNGIGADHVLVLDEAGQLGNRQALRVLEISRITGARLILLGDNKQTGAIEQGKPFWLMQRLGLPTFELTESLRQETRTMKAAVAQARAGDFAGSIDRLDKVVSGANADRLAAGLVAEWTRLKPENRASTNILVLDNATRLVVNAQVRDTLKREGVVAAEDTRLQVLTPAGMTNAEKTHARFYSGGQVVTFARDVAAAGIARHTEYRVLGLGRGRNGREMVRLIDGNGRVTHWDPRLGRASLVNVFQRDERPLAVGDRVQWRLATKTLDLKNADRGTVEDLKGALAIIRWDRADRVQTIDLSEHKTWDHGYAETVYSAQSKTYARAYVLAPVASGLVTGQNFYTAITRARYGVKLWTEDPVRLADKLAARSGEKSSALEGLGRLDRDAHRALATRHRSAVARARAEQAEIRSQRQDRPATSQPRSVPNAVERFAERARAMASMLERLVPNRVDRSPERTPGREGDAVGKPVEPSRGPER